MNIDLTMMTGIKEGTVVPVHLHDLRWLLWQTFRYQMDNPGPNIAIIKMLEVHWDCLDVGTKQAILDKLTAMRAAGAIPERSVAHWKAFERKVDSQ